MPAGREHVVGDVDSIPPGEFKLIPIGRHGVGVYNVHGTFHAIANYCPHQGAPLCEGRISGIHVVDSTVAGGTTRIRTGEFISCPWHQWAFELSTGTSVSRPDCSVRSYPVHIVDGKIVVTA